MNLLDMFEGREPHQQAIDRLEKARIEHLEQKMDYYARHGMAKEFKAAKEERDGYFKVKELKEGEMKRQMHADAERMSREAFCKKYGEEDWVYEFWDAVNGPLDEAGIGQDLVTPQQRVKQSQPQKQTPVGKVVDTAKQAAKWLAGKGGPGREGPTYESQGGDVTWKDLDRVTRLERLRNLAKRQGDHKKFAQLDAEIKDIYSKPTTEDEELDEAIYGADGSPAVANAHAKAIMNTISRPGVPEIKFEFQKGPAVTIPRDQLEIMADYYEAQDNTGKTNFIKALASSNTLVNLAKTIGAKVVVDSPTSTGPLSTEKQLDLLEKKKNKLTTLGDPEADVAIKLARTRHPTAKSDLAAVVKDKIATDKATQKELKQLKADNERQEKEIDDLEDQTAALNIATSTEKTKPVVAEPTAVATASPITKPTAPAVALAPSKPAPIAIPVPGGPIARAPAGVPVTTPKVATAKATSPDAKTTKVQIPTKKAPSKLPAPATEPGLDIGGGWEVLPSLKQAAGSLSGQDAQDVEYRVPTTFRQAAEGSKLHDLGAETMIKKARAAHPIARDDAEALALYIADKEQRDVDHLERENEQEEEMIARIMDQLKKKDLDEHGGGGGGPRQWHAYVRAHRVDEADRGVEATIRTLMAPAYEEETGGIFGYTLEKKAPTMAALREKFHDDLNAILTQASPRVLAQAAQELKDMYGPVAEGWSDAIVARRTGQPRTPYSIYIKGKKWKDFENEDHAENVANKLRTKFKADGRDPSVITIAPTDYDKGLDESKEAVFRSHDIEVEYPEGRGHSHIYHRREPYRLSSIFSDANSVASRNRRAKISLFVDGEYVPNDVWQELDEHGGGVNSMKQYIAWRKSANKERGITKKQPVGKMAPQGRAVPKGTVHGKLDQSRGVIPTSSFHEDETVAETVTDVRAGMAKIYNKLAPKIERYKDSFLANQLYDELEAYAELHGAEREFRQMMATARGRAHMEYDTNPGGFQNWFWFLPFGDEVEEWANTAPGHDLGQQKLTAVREDQDTTGVESAIIRRIMVAHLDWLQKFGPEKVMQAAEEVAYNVGDVDEIGTSDVSAYVHEVGQILGVDQLDEKWSAKYKRSIDCSHPKGFSQRAHCAGRKK